MRNHLLLWCAIAAETKTSSKKLQGALLLILAASLALITSTDSGFFDAWENRTWDLRQRLTADSDQADPQIKIILVDQRSIDQIYDHYGYSWPFPRAQFAELLKFLKLAGARGVAFDHVFTDRSFYGADDDRMLASAGEDDLEVVYAFSPQQEERLSHRERAGMPEKLAAALDLHEPYLRPSGRKRRFQAAALPLAEFIRASSGLGAVMAEPDSDGVIRRYPEGGEYLLDRPPLSDDSDGASNEESVQSDDNGLRRWPFIALGFALYRAAAGDGAWRAAEAALPDAAPVLNYHGSGGTYATYSFSDIVRSQSLIEEQKSPLINPAEFNNAWVFVGVWAPGLMDQRLTPVDSRARAVDVHATALDNLIHRDFARKAGKPSSFLIAFLFLSLAVFSAILPRRLSVQLFGIFASTAGLAGIAFYEASNGVWIELLSPLVIQTLAVITALAYEYAVEGRDHRFIKHAFRHYVSPELIDTIVENPAGLALGGDRRELTMFFSDIVGFIAISERLDPAAEAQLLNEYLSLCAGIILERKGTVDKFVGDGIVAFWNAPVHEPNHPILAVETAIEIQRQLDIRRPEWLARFGADLQTRIGLHTGTVNVGNFGASFRFSYTVIGDAANLASRLEGANKVFGTSIIVSGVTREQIGGKIAFRRLGLIRVAGRAEAVDVYEPLAVSTLKTAEELEVFECSLRAFESGDFTRAQTGFSQLAEKDPVSAAYIRRIAPVQPDTNGTPRFSCWELAEK